MQVAWTPEALADLDRVVTYVEAVNPWAASRLAVQLIAAADSLERLPRRGRPGLELATRELIVTPYVIVYRVTEQGRNPAYLARGSEPLSPRQESR